jgi:hypothetical protein
LGGLSPKVIVHVFGVAVGFKVKRRRRRKPAPLPQAKMEGMPAGFGAYAARFLKGREPFPFKEGQGLRRYQAVPGLGGDPGDGSQDLQTVF